MTEHPTVKEFTANDYAACLIDMLAGWYEGYARADRERAAQIASTDPRAAAVIEVNASAWHAAAHKATEFAKLVRNGE
jgi:hypothetical protein